MGDPTANAPLEKSALSDASLDQLFRSARSYNGYLDKPVSDAQLEAIWDLMKYGPTAANSLPARIIWVKSDEAKDRLAKLVSPNNVAKVMAAPVTAIIGMDGEFYEHLPTLFPHTDAKAWFEGNDASIAETSFRNSSLQGAYLMLAARALGLDCGPMSGFDAAGVNAEFFADCPKVTANFICGIGYGDPASIFERLPRPQFSQFNKIV